MLTDSINKDEIIQAADECVMCGLCLPHCPTYKLAKLEPESPRGRIALVRALYEEQLYPSKTIHSYLDHCLTCMKCESACPANVDYEKIIDAGRAITRRQQSFVNKVQQFFLLFILGSTQVRKIFKPIVSAARCLSNLPIFKRMRLLNLLPDQKHFNINCVKTTNNGDRVVLINSCAADLVSDRTLTAATLLLSELGCNVIEQTQTSCCGALHQHCGDFKNAKTLNDNFLKTYNNQNADYIAILSTGCSAQIQHYKNELDSTLIDINELVLKQLNQNNLVFKPLTKKVFVQKPCSQSLSISEARVIEDLLAFIPGIELFSFTDELGCCGAGGMNTTTHPQLANQLIENKINELKQSDADYLVSNNIGCALHFQARLRQENISTKTCHPITLLAQQVLQ